MSNVLITSLSKKIPLLHAVTKACRKISKEKKVVGADSNSDCISKYFVESFWKMPALDSLDPHDFISYCHQHQITVVIPTRDGELFYFSKYKELFKENQIGVMVSPEKSIRIADDKLLFFQTLKSFNFPVIETTEISESISSSEYVVKERFGAGSVSVGINLSKAEAIKHAKSLSDPIFQPYIKGIEVSVDLYVNHMGKVQGTVLRTRDKIENGESQITTTFKDDQLENQCIELAEKLGLYGHVMFQLIDGQFLECNPRFGGASTLSLAAGLESFYWFFLENQGVSLPVFDRSQEEKTLVRYPKDLII